MSKQLELLFKDAAGKSRKVVIKEPKDNLTPGQAQSALDSLVQADIFFGKEGEDLYATAVGAQYVSRQIEPVYVNPEA